MKVEVIYLVVQFNVVLTMQDFFFPSHLIRNSNNNNRYVIFGERPGQLNVTCSIFLLFLFSVVKSEGL